MINKLIKKHKESDNNIQVNSLLDQADLEFVRMYNKNMGVNKILYPKIQRPGLALVGLVKYIKTNRIQILGKTEMSYLTQLEKNEYEKKLKTFLAHKFPVLIITEEQKIDNIFISIARKYKTPILISRLSTSLLISRITNCLFNHFSRKVRVHGVFLDIKGIGVLIIGKSGIGKSEAALELVNKGNHLISDDLTEFYLNSNEEPIGSSIDKIKNWIEVRGLGIINVVDIFGNGVVTDEKKLDLVIALEEWSSKKKYDRLGEENFFYNILDKDIPMFVIPVSLGRNISFLIEIAVKYYIARRNGSISFLDNYYGDQLDENHENEIKDNNEKKNN